MALFSSKENCVICGEKTKNLKIKDGYVCKKCLQRCTGIEYVLNPAFGSAFLNKKNKEVTKEDILGLLEKRGNNLDELDNFNTTKQVSVYLEIDEVQRKCLIPDGSIGKKINPKIFSFDEIVEYELVEDEESIIKGGLGKAIAGGVLFGGVGAVVGGVTGKKKTKTVVNSLKIKITLNNLNYPNVYINLITTQTKTDSFIYKNAYDSAQQILSMLSIIQNGNNENSIEKNTESNSSLEQIKTLKELLDMGAITEEEFNAKKKELLNL
ncbi:TPA: SHOCT domain-containing protein [Clostridioides difficile]|uniref:SHOCT domain-containing protein n=1 Tax=Clostridioides TaxID=1870884 RepID=UPI00097FDE97|nr:SHOCT domain-containing protein [Clostridioides difficile]MCC0633644.1 SHOCT domain-containing protein [Clostridioides sp. ZZV15-6388]MCC0736173.1 SHOCT domain-containing protein [Clostridioides sp. ZZV14-6009]EGT4537083.1 DUF4428 domain-containing protein [Clostridioides difficile]MCA0747275.1 SHOCT domain-containing protein [Clostridioides difficile]MDV9291992.1 SHOCT domain-containing protein [Clostridioides difficile]